MTSQDADESGYRIGDIRIVPEKRNAPTLLVGALSIRLFGCIRDQYPPFIFMFIVLFM